MLDLFIYENHLGQRYIGIENGVYMNYSELRDYSWNYDTINGRISRFYRSIRSRKIPLVVQCESDDEAIIAKNRLLELAEVDIAAEIPGKIFVGDYYTMGYITASEKSDYLVSKKMCNITLTLTSEDPAWYLEKTYAFHIGGETDEPEEPETPDDPGGIKPTGNLEITSNGNYDVVNYATVSVNVTSSKVTEEMTQEEYYELLEAGELDTEAYYLIY